MKLVLPRLGREQLLREAVDHFNKTSYAGVTTVEKAKLIPSFSERIMVNYLRHQHTNYDSEIWSKRTAAQRRAVRKAVYTTIAGAYPWLAAECARQLRAPQDKTVPLLSSAEYVAKEGTQCPQCHSESIVSDELRGRPNVVYCSVACNDCGATWKNEYRLSGYDNLQANDD